MSSQIERTYIREILLPEIMADFDATAKEYRQDRDLGLRGEFANLYRKARKLKTIVWDGVDASDWREGLRTIVKEVVSHGLLMLVDIDHNNGTPTALPTKIHPGSPQALPLTRNACSSSCTARNHTLSGDCRYRLAQVGED